MYTVYILYSLKYKKLYTGYTSDLIQRFHSHNILGKNNWTVRYRPWVVIYTELFTAKSEAMRREKELKSGKGREWIKEHMNIWISLFR